MKRAILTITFLILLVGYIVFIHKQSEFVAGEYRYYTLYEEYQAKEKYVDYLAKAYDTDIYNLKSLKKKLISDTEILDKYREKLNSYNDSINLISNTVPDYNRYISNLKELKLKIDNQKEIILNFENELNELDTYICKFERDILSIRKYKSDITNVNSVLKSIDSTTKKYNLSLALIQYIAASKGLALEEKIQKEKEIERQNFIAKIEREREFENQQSEQNSYLSDNINNSNYQSNNLVSDYNSNRTIRTTSISSYQTLSSVPDISYYPNIIYSTNTNPNVEQVDGYLRSNGTYVEPYMRTAKNNTEIDNFSHLGNLNSFTGKIGTKK